ncbi:MAG: peptidylprolyl isomerase [Acidobacteriota bacterium]|nr:peptidylprolyl isomerase [Acidobacteriota bacterium]
MKVAKNHVVSMHYTLTGPDGNEIDSSSGSDPFSYLHGARNIVPGLEKALEGKSAGDEFQVELQPEDAYGPRTDELIQMVPRKMFQGADKVEVGQSFRSEGQDGSVRTIVVVDVDGDNVKVDANHPLAGMVLSFDIRVTDVREASTEEIEHGHVH